MIQVDHLESRRRLDADSGVVLMPMRKELLGTPGQVQNPAIALAHSGGFPMLTCNTLKRVRVTQLSLSLGPTCGVDTGVTLSARWVNHWAC